MNKNNKSSGSDDKAQNLTYHINEDLSESWIVTLADMTRPRFNGLYQLDIDWQYMHTVIHFYYFTVRCPVVLKPTEDRNSRMISRPHIIRVTCCEMID